MGKDRLAAFSDGVIAVIITIMVLELKVPATPDWSALKSLVPGFFSYGLSFIYVAIYWNNHHHLLHTVKHVDGAILWANTHLLFWLSLIPLTTAWMQQFPYTSAPAAIYGLILLMAAIAYFILQNLIICSQGKGSLLKQALGRDLKGKISPLLYITGIGFAFISPLLSYLIYSGVALLWLVPDRRIERTINQSASREI